MPWVLILKGNQIGSLTEVFDAGPLAQFNGSRRYSDRLAKCNQSLRIEQLLGENVVYAGLSALKKIK